jgi:RimJ/RimL family protein N-acetyltransferase
VITFHPMESQEEWDWIAARAECVYCSDSKGIVAYRDGKLVGAVSFDHWSHNSCHIHTAFEDMLIFKHGFTEAVFDYIFNQCDKGVIIGVTPACNVKALRFNKHIGFEEVFRLKDGFEEGIDFVVTEYRKENYVQLRKQDGQIRSKAA